MKRLTLILALVLAMPLWAGRSFNGTSDYISANGISTPLDISTGNETVSFWWQPASTGTQCAVCHYVFGTSGGQFAVGIAYGTGSAGQLTWAVGCCGSVTGTSYGNCPTAVTPGHWYQIIMYSVSGSSTGLIVNGGSFCSQTTSWDSANISAGGANFTIGAQSGGLYPASGIIAEVAVWPSNLSAGFKQALANICPVGMSATRAGLPAPVAYFPLWGANSPEPDLSGNVLNGTLTGPPTAAAHAPCTP
jgi:hypothetical protein